MRWECPFNGKTSLISTRSEREKTPAGHFKYRECPRVGEARVRIATGAFEGYGLPARTPTQARETAGFSPRRNCQRTTWENALQQNRPARFWLLTKHPRDLRHMRPPHAKCYKDACPTNRSQMP